MGKTWVAWLLGAALALPTLLVRFPPMTDLAMHAGGIGLLLHWHDEAFVPHGLYWLNLGHPNQLFYGVGYALCSMIGMRAGIGLTVALAQVGIVGGAAILARHLAAPWWTALWVAPVALGWAYFWGLVANLYGIAMFLPAVVLADRLVDHPTARRGVGMALVYVLLFFAHESALCATLWVHLVFFALRSPRRSPWIALGPVAFAVAFALAHMLAVRGIHAAPPAEYARQLVFGPLLNRVGDLPGKIFGAYPPPILLAMASLYGGAVLASRREKVRPRAVSERVGRLWDHRFLVAGLGLLLLYFVAPDKMFVGGWINARFASYAWVLLLPTCASGVEPASMSSRGRRIAVALTSAAFVAPLLVAAPAFLASDRVNKALDRVTERMNPGEAVMVRRLQPRAQDDLYTSVSCGRVLALRGGRCDVDFTQFALSPVRVTERLIWSVPEGVDANQSVVRPAEDLREYRYLLLWSAAAARDRPALERTLAPFARLIVEDDGWLLFESTLPRVTLTTPERL